MLSRRKVPLSKKGQAAVIEFNKMRMESILAIANVEPWYRTNTNFICSRFEGCLSLFYLADMCDDAESFEKKYGGELKQPWKGTEEEKKRILGFLSIREYLSDSFNCLEEMAEVSPSDILSFLKEKKLSCKDYVDNDNQKELSKKQINMVISSVKISESDEITTCEAIIGRKLTTVELNKILLKEASDYEKLYKKKGTIDFSYSYRFVGLDAKRIFFDRSDAKQGKKALFNAVSEYHFVHLSDLVFLNSGKELSEKTILQWMKNYNKI